MCSVWRSYRRCLYYVHALYRWLVPAHWSSLSSADLPQRLLPSPQHSSRHLHYRHNDGALPSLHLQECSSLFVLQNLQESSNGSSHDSATHNDTTMFWFHRTRTLSALRYRMERTPFADIPLVLRTGHIWLLSQRGKHTSKYTKCWRRRWRRLRHDRRQRRWETVTSSVGRLHISSWLSDLHR